MSYEGFQATQALEIDMVRSPAFNDEETNMDRRVFLLKSVSSSLVISTGFPKPERISSDAKKNECAYIEAMATIQQNALGTKVSVKTTNAALFEFGEWATCALWCSIWSGNADVRMLAINCAIDDLMHPRMEEYIELLPDVLDHDDHHISAYGPRMLWKFGPSKARFTIPRLEEKLHEAGLSNVRRVMLAKCIGILDPDRRHEMAEFVARFIDDPTCDRFAWNILAELSGRVPYRGI